MKALWHVNGLSLFYALALFTQSELMVNVYRLERVTGIEGINTWIQRTQWAIFIGSTALFYVLTKSKLGSRKIRYAAVLLWIPYYWAAIKLFAWAYPITDPGEKPLPAIGLVILGMALLYPLYIALINVAASPRLSFKP